MLVQSRFESGQAFEEGEHHQTHTHRGLVPLFSWYAQALWKGCGIKHLAHDAVSSCLVSPSLSHNIWEVSRKVAGEGSATYAQPCDHIQIWTRIGTVWSNKSGKGFNLTWDYLPLGDGLTVMLPFDKDGGEVAPPEV